MAVQKKFIGYLCAFIAAFSLGFHALVIRFLELQKVNTYLISTSRLFIGAAFLTIFIFFQRLFKKEAIFQPGSFRSSQYFWLAAIGLGLNFIFFHKGLQYTIASNAILLETFSSVMVLVLIFLFLPEKIKVFRKRRDFLTRLFFLVIIGSIGSALLIINDPQDLLTTNHSKMWGDLLEFFAMIFFALFFLGSTEHRKQNPNGSPLVTSARFLFTAGLIVAVFLPFSLRPSDLWAMNLQQWGLIVFIGIVSTGITYTLWYHAAKYLDVVTLTLLFNLSSIFTVLWESIFFDLKISWKILLGAILILYSSISAEMIMSKKAEDELEQEGLKA